MRGPHRLIVSLVVLLVLLLALPLVVSAREKRFGYCQTQSAGARVKTCTVEVYLTGTLTHPSQIYQDNIGTPLSNPFTASSTTGLWAFYADNGHYDVKLSGGVPTISPAYTLSDYLLLDLFDVTTTLSAQHFDSTSANISTAGFLRMAYSDLIEWRNSANTGDLALGVVGATGNRPADTLLYPVGMEATFFMSNGVDTSVALGGTLRLHAGDSINWRNSANTNDFVLAKAAAQGNMPETVFVQNQASPGTEGFAAGAFIQNGAAATVAAAGALRLHTGDTINWRNNANNADAVLAKSGPASGNFPADTLFYENPAGSVASFSAGSIVEDGASASVATNGFLRMHSSASLNWRNNANSADVSISKNSSDNLVYPNSLILGSALSATRVNFTGSAPSCTFLTGGGTSPSCSINSNYSDQSGVLSLQTGTGSPGSSGTFSITYSAPFSTVSSCVLMLDNVGSSWNARATLFGGGFNASGSGTITWDNNAVALGASSSYTVHYICGGK